MQSLLDELEYARQRADSLDQLSAAERVDLAKLPSRWEELRPYKRCASASPYHQWQPLDLTSNSLNQPQCQNGVTLLPPEISKWLSAQFRVAGGVLDVSVAQPKLQPSRIVTSIGQ